jgi:hypothetical protein
LLNLTLKAWLWQHGHRLKDELLQHAELRELHAQYTMAFLHDGLGRRRIQATLGRHRSKFAARATARGELGQHLQHASLDQIPRDCLAEEWAASAALREQRRNSDGQLVDAKVAADELVTPDCADRPQAAGDYRGQYIPTRGQIMHEAVPGQELA